MSALHVHPVSAAPPAASAPHQVAPIRPAGPNPAPTASHGPAVILAGALAKPAEHRPQPKAPPPAAATGQYVNRVI